MASSKGTSRQRNAGCRGDLIRGRFAADLCSRRVLQVELPEFIICALETRVAEINRRASPEECCTLGHLIESELVNLVSLRDVAELESTSPGSATLSISGCAMYPSSSCRRKRRGGIDLRVSSASGRRRSQEGLGPQSVPDDAHVGWVGECSWLVGASTYGS